MREGKDIGCDDCKCGELKERIERVEQVMDAMYNEMLWFGKFMAYISARIGLDPNEFQEVLRMTRDEDGGDKKGWN